MHSPLRLYTSQPAATKLADLALGLERPGRPVMLRPLSDLPTPHPQRLVSLRVEYAELQASLASTNQGLANLASGHWQPNAGLESGLRADKDALESRLRAVARTLEAQAGGRGNV